jgi:hypothetical protein
MSCTMLIRLPTRALSNDDFPTLGRPTIATTGMRCVGLDGFVVASGCSAMGRELSAVGYGLSIRARPRNRYAAPYRSVEQRIEIKFTMLISTGAPAHNSLSVHNSSWCSFMSIVVAA